MTSKLRISADLCLPLDTVTQTIGILAKRRAGKSYLARRFTEQLVHANQQVVIVDPKGDWWGCRSGADGKSDGLKIVILGGEHGDVPLEVQSGEMVAQLAVEERVSMLLDLSLFRKYELATFMAAFLEAMYRLKAREIYRTPVMLMIDEADAIAPQHPMKGSNEERMLGAANDIVRRGGQRGIGCCVISQRSAVLNKNVLTQVQLLITLRTIAPQDLAAINAWVDVHGTQEERKILMASLPALPVGEAWYWSPGWPTDEGIFQRGKTLAIETYDSGATPKSGEKRREPKMAAEVDLDAFRKRMASAIEKAKADDPRELRKRIAELEKALARAPGKAVVPAVKVERVEVPLFDKAAFRDLQDEISKNVMLALNNNKGALHVYMSKALEGAGAKYGLAGAPRTLKGPLQPERVKYGMGQPKPARQPLNRPPVTNGKGLGAGERAVLTAVAQAQAGATREQVSIMAGYKPSTRNAYLQRLGAAGYLTDNGGLLVATDDGLAVLGPEFEPLPTGTALQDYWRQRLPEGERKIFEVLLGAYPRAVDRDTIGIDAGYKASTRNAYIQRLGVRKLIKIAGGNVLAADDLFD